MKVMIGDIADTIYGERVEVLEICGNDITVEFKDKSKFVTVCSKHCLIEGKVKGPFTRTVKGVGYIGLDARGRIIKNPTKTLAYNPWHGMLDRCYSKMEKHSSYSDVKVCDEWLSYYNFSEWFNYEFENYVWWSGMVHVDKDILSDKRLYGPTTSCLIPPEINSLITRNTFNKNGKLPGVVKTVNGYKVTSGYGSSKVVFYSELDAHMAYLDSKKIRIKEIANKFKQKIKPEIYDSLLHRDFRHLFSPLYSKSETGFQ